MSVNLRSQDTFVTKHFLDGTQLGAAFEEVGRKAMAEGVRRDVFVNSRHGGVFFHDEEKILAGERFSVGVEEGLARLFVGLFGEKGPHLH